MQDSYQNPNTRIRVENLTEAHCEAILDAYESCGLRISASSPLSLLTAKDYLEERRSIEFRPDGRTQNKLDFDLKSGEDDKRYIHLTARPLSEKKCSQIQEDFDKKIRALELK